MSASFLSNATPDNSRRALARSLSLPFKNQPFGVNTKWVY